MSRLPLVACVSPLLAIAMPYFNSAGQIAVFVIALSTAILIGLVWWTVRAMLKDIRVLLQLVKSYLALTGQQQQEAARLVSETPNVVASTVKRATKEAIGEVRADDRRSDEMHEYRGEVPGATGHARPAAP